jgi:hypothetical protein
MKPRRRKKYLFLTDGNKRREKKNFWEKRKGDSDYFQGR